MSTNAATLREQGFGQTQRRDTWWVQPLAMAVAFVVFIIYATFRGIYNGDYEYGHGALSNSLHPDSAYFLSPFYSPLLALPQSMAWICPAIFVMWMPAGFRVTCYYARRAYYRALFADPPACAVAEVCKKNYKGERGAWIFQNIHRYFLYLRAAARLHAHLPRDRGVSVAGGGRWNAVWRERGDAGVGGRFSVPHAVCVFVPFVAALGWRPTGLFFGVERRNATQTLELLHGTECLSRFVFLVQLVHGWVRRFLCVDGVVGAHSRPEIFLSE